MACTDIAPTCGLCRQRVESRLPVSQARYLPQAGWAPSQPWPCGRPASDAFRQPAMLAAGVENTGLKLVRRGSCGAWPSKGRAVTEDSGEDSPVAQNIVLLCNPVTPATDRHHQVPRFCSLAPTSQLWLFLVPQPGSAQCGETRMVPTTGPCPGSPPGHETLTFVGPSMWLPHRAGVPPVLPAANPHPVGWMLCPGHQAGLRPRHPQDDPGSCPGRKRLQPLNTPAPTPSCPTPGSQQRGSQGRRHKREPRLLEPPLPWGRGPQDPHLVAIEEEKL